MAPAVGARQVDPMQMALGMTLIVLSQATQSAQCVAEDYMMSEMNVPALTVVGIEGLFGTVALFAVILPIAQVIPLPAPSSHFADQQNLH